MTNLWTNVEDLGDYAESDYAYDAVKTASFLMWALSGRKFSGVTTVTERYVSTQDPYLRGIGAFQNYEPVLVNGEMYNVPGGGRTTGDYDTGHMGDGTNAYSRVRLRGRKVVKVHAMRDIDGNIIDPSQYYMGDHSTIYAAPGAQWTSQCVEVSYTYGTPPPTMGKAAARMLALELVKLYEDDDTCALPQRVTSVTRQGVSYTILDDQAFIDELKTGLYAVDLFLKAVNPDKARARARVFSPDISRARRITGQAPRYALTDQDLYISANGGSVLSYLTDISAEFLLLDPAWVISATISDLSDTRVATVGTDPVLYTVNPNESITVTASYSEVLAILGPRDPGVLDIYATRPSIGNPLVDEVVNISSSNIIYRFGSPVTPVYTA